MPDIQECHFSGSATKTKYMAGGGALGWGGVQGWGKGCGPFHHKKSTTWIAILWASRTSNWLRAQDPACYSGRLSEGSDSSLHHVANFIIGCKIEDL